MYKTPAELLVGSFRNPKFKRRICLEDSTSGAKLTYADMDRETALSAGLLKSFYVNPGDTVSLLLQNGLHFFMPWLGAMRIGAVAHPINYLYRPDQVLYALKLCQTKLLITEDRYVDEYIGPIRERFPELPVIVMGEKAGLARTYKWSTLMQFIRPYDHIVHRNLEDPFQLICTSGTTGKPKAVVQHCGMFEPNVRDLIEVYKLTESDRTLLVNRLFHVNAQVTNFFPMALLGGRTVLAPANATQFLKNLKKHRITFSSVIPTTLKEVLKTVKKPIPRESWRYLRFLITGADVLQKDLHRAFMQRTGVPVRPGWGMTETLCWGSGTRVENPIMFGSCGTSLPHTEMKIVDGRLYARGDNVFKKYFRNPEATEKSFVKFDEGEKWFDTGDTFSQDSRGTYYFICRASADSWKVKGEFVVGPEIDNYVGTHPAVDDAMAVPIVLDGETETALCIVKKEEVGADAILEWCEDGRKSGKLEKHYKIKQIIFVPKIELGDTGKKSRKKMTELAAAL